MLSTRAKQPGFTLVEMAIVVVVIGLVFGGILRTVSVQRQQVMRDETRQQLEVIKDALIGFVLTNQRLPCPDTDLDGLENVTAGACDAAEGFLPFANIGIGERDAWGNIFRYRMTAALGASPGPSIVMGSAGDMTIANDVGTIATTVPAIVISYGQNGAVTIASINCAAGTPSANEDENCNNDQNFSANFYSNLNGSEFDDLVIWIPMTLLISRMVDAQLLP